MTTKIAISLPDEQVAALRRAVEEGRAASVSGCVSAALEQYLRADSLARLLDDLEEQRGQVGQADLDWADQELGLS